MCNRSDGLVQRVVRPRTVAAWTWFLPLIAVGALLVPNPRVRLTVSVCQAHARRAGIARWGGPVLIFLGLAALASPEGLDYAVILLVAGCAWLALVASVVRVASISGDCGWFLVGDAFLASLPARPTSQPVLDDDE